MKYDLKYLIQEIDKDLSILTIPFSLKDKNGMIILDVLNNSIDIDTFFEILKKSFSQKKFFPIEMKITTNKGRIHDSYDENFLKQNMANIMTFSIYYRKFI